MSIEVKNVSKIYGKQFALDDVSLSIKTGEVVGFLGPNGAGKSTMMKILTTYIAPSSGEAWLAGYHVEKEHMKVKVWWTSTQNRPAHSIKSNSRFDESVNRTLPVRVG